MECIFNINNYCISLIFQLSGMTNVYMIVVKTSNKTEQSELKCGRRNEQCHNDYAMMEMIRNE